jgi:hypothetical protein
MAQDQWAPGAYIIYIFIAIDVIESRAQTSFNKQGIAPHRPEGPHRTVHATG